MAEHHSDPQQFAMIVGKLLADDPLYAARLDRAARKQFPVVWAALVVAGWCMAALLLLAVADWTGLLVGLPLAMFCVWLGGRIRPRK